MHRRKNTIHVNLNESIKNKIEVSIISFSGPLDICMQCQWKEKGRDKAER